MAAELNDLQEIFRDLFDSDDILLTPQTTAQDVAGWDSLTNVKLIVRVERAFRIRFDTGEVVGLDNVGQLLGLIQAKQSKR